MKSMRREIRQSMFVAGCLLSSTLIMAETVLIETQPEGQNREFYSEPTGEWTADLAFSQAEGLTPEGSTRALVAADGKLAGSALFSATVENGGEYHVDIAIPASANAKGVTVELTGAAATTNTKIDFFPGDDPSANQWLRIGSVNAAAGGTVAVRIDGDSAAGPFTPDSPYSIVIDAVRFTNEQLSARPAPASLAVAGGAPVVANTAMDALGIESADKKTALSQPFDQPAETKIENPFEIVEPNAERSPFDEEPARQVSSPFTEKTSEAKSPFSEPAQEQSSPFDQQANTADNPFEDEPATTESPFADAPSGDPFASSNSDNEENPFEQTTSGDLSIKNPFEKSPQKPVATQAEVKAPFATSGDSPFDKSAESATASNPFDKTSPGSTTVSNPFDRSPGAGETKSPFAAGENLATPPPVVDAPVAANSSAPSPFSNANKASSAPVNKDRTVDIASLGESDMLPISVPAMAGGPTVSLKFEDSIEKAVARGKTEGKPVLVLFSGESMKAQKFEQVLADPKVADTLDGFILARVDYRQNRDIAGKYSVTSFPYSVVLNSQGYTVGHVLPITNENRLISTLEPFTLRFFQ